MFCYLRERVGIIMQHIEIGFCFNTAFKKRCMSLKIRLYDSVVLQYNTAAIEYNETCISRHPRTRASVR